MNECNCKNIDGYQIYHLLWVWGIIFVIAFLCQFAAPYLFEGDVMVMLRQLVLNQIPNIIEAGMLMTVVVLFDVITPGDTLRCATQEPLSSAIIMGTLIIALALLFKSAY